MSTKVDVATGADDPNQQSKADKQKKTNLDAAHAAASAVGNQDNDSTPAPAKGSGPGINKSGSVEQNAASAGRTNQKGDH
ncbi:TPA: hypothetical protein ACH3X2_000430 [Trebouxia sp. C0005]|nr:MAG: hypothetical protein FRX49_05202 [Trebouxia sp. A1-2]